jgi:3-hydroxybutyrate dehydrogenase
MMLEGRTALITGSTSGIGLGIARALARAGAGIVLNGFGDEDEIERLRGAISVEYGVRVEFFGADIALAGDVESLVERTIAEFSSLDILVNNAGIQHVAPIETFPPERWDAIIATNLSSNYHSIRFALPHMRARNWGRIINIASTHGLVASAQKSAYVAAKHGVIGLTKVVALETATTGITCNAICPGFVLTPLVQQQIDDFARREGLSEEEAQRRLLSEKQPSLEFATPEQIGGLATFLCSNDAAQIRGAALTMDGGWTAQ